MQRKLLLVVLTSLLAVGSVSVAFAQKAVGCEPICPVIPEPMSVMLGLMGLGGIAGWTRLRRN